MKRALSFFLMFCIVTPSLALTDNGVLDKISHMGTVQTTAKKLCIEGSEDLQNFIGQYKQICQITKNSDICKKVPPEESLLCEDPDENDLDLTSFSFIKNCAHGLWSSLKDLFNFLIESIKGILGYTFFSDTRDKANQALGEYYDTFSNYLAIEYDKLKDKDEAASDFEIVTKLAGKLIDTLFLKMGNIIKENYYNLGCYRQSARQDRLCKIIGDFTVPPAAAVGLIMGVPKLTKKLKLSIKKKDINIEVTEKAPIAIKFKNNPRNLSPDEMKSKNTQALATKLGLIIDKTTKTVATAPQLNQNLKLLVMKTNEGKLETMGNPTLVHTPATQTSEVLYFNNSGKEVSRVVHQDELPQLEAAINDLEGIISIERIQELENKYGLSGIISKLETKERQEISKWLNELSTEESRKLLAFKKTFAKDLKGTQSKLSLAYSLRESKHVPDLSTNIKEVLDMYSLFIKEEGTKKFKKFNQWVKSDAHALYLYDHISEIGLNQNLDLLRYLQTYNDYFKKAHGTRGPPTLVTYSFEKESKKANITDWYKVAGISDEEWFKLDVDMRLDKLKEVTNVKKQGVSDDIITATDKKPLYLGRYSEELSTHPSGESSFAWEIANKKYEINLDRTLNQVREVSKAFKEGHSFHTHVVFDMPKTYKHFDRFQTWSKQTNDYLYLKGMEEGLHGNYLTNVAYFPEDKSLRLEATVENKLPDSLGSINFQSHKFFSMGIRKDIYGNSPLIDHDKLGLELRDTTRNLDTLSDHMQRISGSVQDYRWENWDPKIDRKGLPFLRPHKDLFQTKYAAELSSEFKDLISGLDVNTSIPLIEFENGKYFNFGNKTLSAPTPDQISRLVKAREHYISELKNIEAELKKMDARNEAYEADDVKMALRMTLTEWARIAKAADLFQNI